MRWLISYSFRRVFRSGSGEVEVSARSDDRIEFSAAHPAVWLANAAAALRAFTEEERLADAPTVCDRVERIYSATLVPDDAVTEEQREALAAFCED